MDNEDPIAAGEDPVRADELELAADAETAADPEQDTFELELDGQVHTLPAALKGAFLMQADYTRKTQELAEHRRAVEAERKALAEQAAQASGASRDRVRLAALDHRLEEFQDLDWQGYAAADPEAAQALWNKFQAMSQAREQLASALSHHAERGELQAAREAAERMAETGRRLQQEIDGWSPEVAAKLVEYAQAFGVTLEELSQMADPRLWKVLHRAYQADQAGQRDAAARAQAVRPAVLVAGSAAGAGGVRDDLGIKEWMARRNEQAMRGR